MIEHEIELDPDAYAVALAGRVRVAIPGSRKDSRPSRLLVSEAGSRRCFLASVVAHQHIHEVCGWLLPIVVRSCQDGEPYAMVVIDHPPIAIHEP